MRLLFALGVLALASIASLFGASALPLLVSTLVVVSLIMFGPRITVPLVGLFMLAACATGSPSQDFEKGLIAAHATYDGISIALQTATATGILHGSAAQTAQSAYDQVGKDLAEADTAWAAGNAALAATAVANAGMDSAKVTALIPKN